MITLTSAQLNRAARIKDQIENLNRQLTAILGSAPATVVPRKGGMSAAGRARIAAAQKARWAKINAAKGAAKPRRKMSAAAKAKIAAAARARWAKQKAAKE